MYRQCAIEQDLYGVHGFWIDEFLHVRAVLLFFCFLLKKGVFANADILDTIQQYILYNTYPMQAVVCVYVYIYIYICTYTYIYIYT